MGGLSPALLAAALLVRILLLPLQHTWDSQTWLATAADLGGEANPIQAVAAPYERMRHLSDLVHGMGLRPYYEGWAYPPGMLLIWWPVARAWSALNAVPVVHTPAPDAFTAAALPLPLAGAMKLPVWLADLAAGVLLARLAGPAAGRWYLFNPFVLLASLWTFDGLMVALLLGGLAAANKARWGWAGVLLGLGAAVKFVPLLFVPLVGLWAVRHSSRPLRSALTVTLGALLAFGGVCAMWWDDVAFVIGFHAARPGGGMSWQGIWGALALNDPFLDLAPVFLYVSAALGALTLSGALLLATSWIWHRRLELLPAALVLAMAYLAGSKLVNEVYPLPAVALATAVWARGGPGWVRALRNGLAWVPIAFAAVNVPAWGFLVSAGLLVGWLQLEQAREFHAAYVLTYRELAPVLALVGLAFQAGCAWAAWRLGRESGI